MQAVAIVKALRMSGPASLPLPPPTPFLGIIMNSLYNWSYPARKYSEGSVLPLLHSFAYSVGLRMDFLSPCPNRYNQLVSFVPKVHLLSVNPLAQRKNSLVSKLLLDNLLLQPPSLPPYPPPLSMTLLASSEPSCGI